MKLSSLLVFALILIPHTALAANPAATQSAKKDGVSITVSLKQQAISTSEQPFFTVRFTNIDNDYINLYDVKAYCDWDIEFIPAAKEGVKPVPLHLKMDKLPRRIPIAHLQIKPTESLEVPIDLNDPPFTFHFETAHPGDHAPVIRHLPPGNYQVALTIKLTQPFGPGTREWEGPLTTKPIALTVGPPNPDQDAPPTPEQSAAYTAAIHRWTDKFDGLWLNGRAPQINLPSDAKPEDVIEAAVNQTVLESKAYRILQTEPFIKETMVPKIAPGTTAVVMVGKAYKVVIIFPYEKSGWWSRFYDAEIPAP